MPEKRVVYRAAIAAFVVVSLSANVVLGLYLLSVAHAGKQDGKTSQVCEVVRSNDTPVQPVATNGISASVVLLSTNVSQKVEVEKPPSPISLWSFRHNPVGFTAELFGEIDAKRLQDFVTISPFVPLSVRLGTRWASSSSAEDSKGNGYDRYETVTTLLFTPADPKQPLVPGTTYRVTFKKGLPSTSKAYLPLVRDEMRIFTVMDARASLGLRADPEYQQWENCFIFPLNKEIDDRQDLLEFISISPKIPIRVEKVSLPWNSSCDLRVFAADNEQPFAAGAEYTVTLKQGLLAKNGEAVRPLMQDCVGHFVGPQWSDELVFATEGTFFRLNSTVWELPIESVNSDNLEVTLAKIYPNRLAEYVLARAGNQASDRWWRQSAWEEQRVDFEQTICEKKIALPLARNRKNYSSLSFEALGIPRKPGAYSLDIRDGAQRIVVLTDLALAVMRGDHEYMVNVRTLAGNAPVTNATVKLYSRKLQVLAETTTDANGFARLAYAALTDKGDEAGLIFAQCGEDATYISARDFTHGMVQKAEATRVTSLAAGMGALLFAERGICRPGESIGLFGYLREAVTLKAKGGVPLVMEVRNPSGILVSSATLTGSKAGFYQTYVKIEPSAATGEYTFELRMPGGKPGAWRSGTKTFQVGEYVPDRVKLETKFASETVKPGDSLAVKGRADYYFGAPLLWARYMVDVRESVVPFKPLEWKGFSFGTQRGKAAKGSAVRTFKAEGVLTDGTFADEIQVGLRPDAPVLPVEYRAVTTIMPSSGRSVSSTTSLLCHYRDFYLGVKDDGAHGGNRRLRVVAVTPQEKLHELNTTNYFYVLTRKDWDYRLVKKEGRTTYEWQEVRHDYKKNRLKLTSVPGAESVYDAEIPVPQDGSYELSILDGAEVVCAATTFWHDAGESGERSRNPSVMKFDLDKEKYAPGGVARVSFDALAAGEAVIMTGTATIDATFTRRVKAGRNTIELPIPATCSEGSYFAGVTVVVDDGFDGRSPKRLSGLVRLNVDQKARELKVRLETSSVARPRGSETIRITVTDAQGKPAAAEVQVWAVDRGILSLTAWKTPNVWRGFFGEANCPFLLNDTYKDLYPELRVVNGKIGGGDALSGFMVKDKSVLKAPAILKLQTVQIPATGVAEVTFDNLPDFTGSLMVSAVAADTMRAGGGSTELVMRDELSLEMDAPQAVAPGDRFNVSFTCFNHEAEGARATWSVRTKGLDLQNPQVKGGELKLAQGERALVRVPVVVRPDAVELDAAELEAVLRVGAVAVTNAVRLAARPARTVTTRMTNILVAADSKMTFTCADAGMASYVRGDVWIGSPSLALVGAIKALDEYPCHCAEQTTSRAFPYLMMDELVARGVFPASRGETTAEKINRARARLVRMQLSDGYYAMWPGWDWRWKSASLYVWHFLLEAHARGYALDPEERTVIAANLRRFVNNRYHRISDRAYATYVLALADAAFVEGAARAILTDSKSQLFDRFLAGAALVKANFAREGAEVIKKVWDGPFYACPGGDYSSLDSETRRIGLALWILNDVLPDAQVVARLSNVLLQKRCGDGSWGTTQNNAWAALGLARAAAKSGPRGKIRFVTSSGAEQILADGRSVHKSLTGGFTFTIDNQDSSPVFVSLRHLGVPRKSEDVRRGFAVTREYRTPEGHPLTSCKAGDLVVVRLSVDSRVSCDNIVLSDMLPGGFDIEDDRLATRGFNLVTVYRTVYGKDNKLDTRRIEKLGDRFIALGNVYEGKGWVEYKVRAVTPGVYAIPDVSMDAMYNPELKGLTTTTHTFEVTE